MIGHLTEHKPYTQADYRKEPPCPSCGTACGVFVSLGAMFTTNGLLILPGRIEGWCDIRKCDQRYWVYPWSKRVTRRNTGETLKERHMRLGHY